MGTNRRYGAPSERAATRRQAAHEYVPAVPKVRHVWVRSSPREGAFAYPGLVLEWRRDRSGLETSGWIAHVAYLPSDEGHLIVTWVPSEELLPIEVRRDQ